MSLLSTIAYPGATRARRFSLHGVVMMAVGLILGVAAGSIIPDISPATDMSETARVSPGGLTHDEFLRLNTTNLEFLSPTVPARVVEAQVAADPFLYWNTTALEGLVPPPSDAENSDLVTARFLEWNITSLQYPGSSYSEPSSGPR